MGYQQGLEAAGFKVHAFKRFGSYSGKWAAIVSQGAGDREVVIDSFGSCSICDAFECEFQDSFYDNESSDDTFARLKAFGERYTSLPFIHELAKFTRAVDSGYIDPDDEEMLVWLLLAREGEYT